MILPEEIELERLEAEQDALKEQVTSAELESETVKVEIAQFEYQYYKRVGRLYVQLDDIDAMIAKVKASLFPDDIAKQTEAFEAEKQAQQSAEEAGIIESKPAPPIEITPELKVAFRKAAKLMHPDLATTETERVRRSGLMIKANLAYECGDQQAIEKLIAEYSLDPEEVSGDDVASRIVKAIRRIAQLRRRRDEMKQDIADLESAPMYKLWQTTLEVESMGGDSLGDLEKQLLQEISERNIELEVARHQQVQNMYAS